MVKKKSTIIIFSLIVAVYICLSSAIYFYKKYNSKNNLIDIVFLSKLKHINLTSDNNRIKELSIETIAQAEALCNFTSYYKNNEELYQSISMLYDLELSNEKFQPYYSEIQAYIQKLYSNPNDKDIAKEFLKFLKDIPSLK